MRNYVQAGNVVTLPAPYTLASGEGFAVGSLFAVAATDAQEGAEVEGAVVGVYELPKVVTDVMAVGTKLYWDGTAKKLTVDDTETLPVGAAIQVAGNGAAKVRIRLNGAV